MSWFSRVWASASSEAKKAANELTTTATAVETEGEKRVQQGYAAAKAVLAKTEQAAKQVESSCERELAEAKHHVERVAIATEEKLVTAAKAVLTKTEEAAKEAKASSERELAKAKNEVRHVAVATEEKLAKKARSAYATVRQTFHNIKIRIITAECSAAQSLGHYVAAPERRWLQDWITGIGRSSEQKPYDGMVITDGCNPVQPEAGKTYDGIRPDKCPKGKSIPKITFVNGIQTKFINDDDRPMCRTMKKIANATCSEVVGIYNATEGVGADLRESLENIRKAAQSDPTHTLSVQLVTAAQTGQPLVIFAHSQGGLITQDALADAKNNLMYSGMTREEAEQALSVVTVRSFGTAERGWPVGPTYQHFNNEGDPVPSAIAGAQEQYQEVTNSDSDPTKTEIKPMRFTSPGDFYKNHFIEDSYVPEMSMEPGPRDCDCQ